VISVFSDPSPEQVLRVPYQSRTEFNSNESNHTFDDRLRLPPIEIRATRKSIVLSKINKFTKDGIET
jgi:hypothetical protein